MNDHLTSATSIKMGIEDKFFYEIGEGCAMCGTCADECPTNAITDEGNTYRINPLQCIDCGTCSAVCPLGIPRRMAVSNIDLSKCYFNPGCALSLYKPFVAKKRQYRREERHPTICPTCCLRTIQRK